MSKGGRVKTDISAWGKLTFGSSGVVVGTSHGGILLKVKIVRPMLKDWHCVKRTMKNGVNASTAKLAGKKLKKSTGLLNFGRGSYSTDTNSFSGDSTDSACS